MAIQVNGGGGGGAAGNTTSTDTQANIPAAGTDGNLFLPSDGVSIYRDTGSAWVPWGPSFPLTEPVNGDFSWVNQGGASVDDTYGGIYLTAPAAAGEDIHARVKSAPATPYTVTAWFIPHFYAYDYLQCGLCFRQSSDGKLVVFNFVHSIVWSFNVNKFTDENTFAAQYTAVRYNSVERLCLRIADDGANRICSWSLDGQHFIQVHSIGRTDFLTADQVGFYAQARNATYTSRMLLLSWAEG